MRQLSFFTSARKKRNDTMNQPDLQLVTLVPHCVSSGFHSICVLLTNQIPLMASLIFTQISSCLTHLIVRSSNHSHSLNNCFTRLVIHPTRSLIHPVTNSITYPPTHSLSNCVTNPTHRHSLIKPPTHWFTLSNSVTNPTPLTNQSTHSLSHCLSNSVTIPIPLTNHSTHSLSHSLSNFH